MFAKQFYWYKLSRAFFKLGRLWAFQLSLDRFPLFLTGRILIGWLRWPGWPPGLATWWPGLAGSGGLMGVGNLTISGKLKLRSGPPVMVLALAASHLYLQH